MKKFHFVLFIPLWLNCFGILAQKFSDHPEIGRYPNSVIHHQEISNFNEYYIAVGPVEEGKVTASNKIAGQVNMTLYKGPENASSFEIFRAYQNLLESKGFSILLECEKSQCGEKFLGPIYDLAPFASNYGWNNSAPITNSNTDFSYILTAKRIEGERETYVSLIVSQGWWSYPAYKLDVIDVAKDIKEIISITHPGEESAIKKPAKRSLPEDQEFNSLEIKIGAGSYLFIDPILAGSRYEFKDNNTGTITGGFSGFNLLGGFYFNTRYFFNENFGISVDLNVLMGNEEMFTPENNYKSNANMVMEKIGLVGRLNGSYSPVSLSMAFGAGFFQGEFYESIESTITSTGVYLIGKVNKPMFYYNTELMIPLFRSVFIFGQYEYNFMISDLIMEHDGGNDYTKTYRNVNFGGHHARLGIGWRF